MTLSPHLDRMTYRSPLGAMTLAASEKGLAGAWFDGQQHDPAPAVRSGWSSSPNPLLDRAAAQLQAYFEGTLADFDLPLDLSAGTPFQQAVWQELLHIRRGSTTSYGDVAERIGKSTAVRAVGAAVGRNPLGIIVPCHRVMGRDGSLTGYAGGLERKVALLKIEKVLL
jgi:methylated-DNA-[protein]-cysteine S-methyltransferase